MAVLPQPKSYYDITQQQQLVADLEREIEVLRGIQTSFQKEIAALKDRVKSLESGS